MYFYFNKKSTATSVGARCEGPGFDFCYNLAHYCSIAVAVCFETGSIMHKARSIHLQNCIPCQPTLQI